MASTSGALPPFENDFTKLFANLKLPFMPNMDALMAAQRRNIEAMTQAYQVTLQGGQEVARRHMEIMQQATAGLSETMRSIAGSGTPQEKASRQADLLRKTYEQAMSNMREMSETIQHTNAGALELLNQRFTEAMNEVKALTGNK